VAAFMSDLDPKKAYQLPDTHGLKNEVIIQKCDHFGEEWAIRMPGAQFVDIGAADVHKGRRPSLQSDELPLWLAGPAHESRQRGHGRDLRRGEAPAERRRRSDTTNGRIHRRRVGRHPRHLPDPRQAPFTSPPPTLTVPVP